MLVVQDKLGNALPLVGFENLNRKKGVNGEKQISFTLFPCQGNELSFPMVDNENIIYVADEPYVILTYKPVVRGRLYYKEVSCIHKFFVDMIDRRIYTAFTRSFTLTDFMTEVFRNTGYTFSIEGTFYAEDFENFGNGDTNLACFKQGIQRYGIEFEIQGTNIRLKKKKGRTDLAFHLRYDFNVRDVDTVYSTKDLTTYIQGTGKRDENGVPLITGSYTSPNASYYGLKHAEPIDDERYTTQQGLDDALRASINDEPEVSIKVPFVDLRKAGYPFEQPQDGDEIYLIVEHTGMEVKVRIMEIDEMLDENLEPYDTELTLANFSKKMTDIIADFNDTKRSVDGLIGRNGRVKFSVLDEMVKITTRALLNAQTEVEFTESGLILRSKTDPNFLVLINSAGIGISDNAGASFREAITGEGFNLTAGAIGRLAADHVEIGSGTLYEQGYNPRLVESAAKAYADGLKAETNSDIADLRSDLETLDGYIDGAFSDGVITKAEAISIKKYLNQVNAEKADLDARYTQVYNNSDLTGTSKTTLATRKTELNTAHTNLVNSINAAITDNTATPAEVTDVNTKYAAFNTALSNISTAFEAAINQIGINKSNAAVSAANSYTDTIKGQLQQEIGDVEQSVTDLNGYIENSFADGIISEAEAVAIEKYINTVNAEKSDMDNRYTAVYNNADLVGSDKTNLLNSKTAFNTAHTNLISAINTAIADSRVSAAEKTDVDNKFALFRSALADLSTKLEVAVNTIAKAKADKALFDSKAYADTLNSAVNADINDLDTRMNTLDGYLENAFRDGIIDEAEAAQINGMLTLIKNEKEDIDARFNETYNNSDLTGGGMFYSKYQDFLTRFNDVNTQITNAIADSKITGIEKANIDYALLQYRAALKALGIEFEKANSNIAQNKATRAKTEAKTDLKNDLRMTAPLPTHITMNADGIRATAAGATDRYTQLDYRGLYAKKGAIWVEGSDGRTWIQDGILRNSLIVQGTTPQFKGDNVGELGRYFTITQSDYDFFGAYRFNHEGRYLVIEGFVLVTDAGITIAAQSYQGLGFLQTVNIARNSSETGGQPFTLTVDLGVPTYAPTSFYIKIRSANAPGMTRCRVNFVTQRD